MLRNINAETLIEYKDFIEEQKDMKFQGLSFDEMGQKEYYGPEIPFCLEKPGKERRQKRFLKETKLYA